MQKYNRSMDLVQWARDNIKDFGWCVLYISDDLQTPFGVSYHTFGLRETFDHPDLQICLPIDQDVAHSMFTTLVEQIRNGARFEDGGNCVGLLRGGYSYRFAAARNDGRKLLRVLVPDEDDSLVSAPYSRQLDMLSDGRRLAALHYEVGEISTTDDVELFMLSLVLDYHLALRPGIRFESLINRPAGTSSMALGQAARLDGLLQRCYQLYEEEEFNDILEVTLRATRAKVRQVQSKQRRRDRRHRRKSR